MDTTGAAAGSDWFSSLLGFGGTLAGDAATAYSANQQASSAGATAVMTAAGLQQQRVDQATAFNQALLASQVRSSSGLPISSNMLIMIMIGVVALFVINQANK